MAGPSISRSAPNNGAAPADVTEASGAVMYLFMALMLLLRPRGLLGERWERFE